MSDTSPSNPQPRAGVAYRGADLEQARGFMRFASLRAGATQISDAIANHVESLPDWLEAAALERHFDAVIPPSIMTPRPLEFVTLAYKALSDLLVKRTMEINHADHPANSAYAHLVNSSNASFKPVDAVRLRPVLEQIAQCNDASFRAVLEGPDGAIGSNRITTMRNDQLRILLCCALSCNDVEFVRKWMSDPTLTEAPNWDYVPDFLINKSFADVAEGRKDVRHYHHLSAVAIHFGADDCLRFLIDKGFDVTSRAGLAFKDDMPGLQHVDLSEVLSASMVRFQPSTLKLVNEEFARTGLTRSDRAHLGEFCAGLARKMSRDLAWGGLILETGLYSADPARVFRAAAEQADRDVLERLKGSYDWWEPKRMGHPALCACSSKADVDLRHAAVSWALDETEELGPQAVDALLQSTDEANKGLAELLIMQRHDDLLVRLLDLGLDPLKRIRPDVRSAMEAAADHHPPTESLLLAHLAKRAAREAMAELGVDEPRRLSQAPPAFLVHLQQACEDCEMGFAFEEGACWGMALELQSSLREEGCDAELMIRDGFTHCYVRSAGVLYDWQGDCHHHEARVVDEAGLIQEARDAGFYADDVMAQRSDAARVITRAKELAQASPVNRSSRLPMV